MTPLTNRDVFSIDGNRGPSRCAQRHVQDRPLFREVDLLPPIHRVDSLLKAGFFGQLNKLQRFVGDAILRVIEVDPGSLRRHPLATLGIIREKLAEMEFPNLLSVGFERLPCRAFDGAIPGEWFDALFHVLVPFVSYWLVGNEPLVARKVADCRPPKGETLRETRWRCRPRGNLEAALSVS